MIASGNLRFMQNSQINIVPLSDMVIQVLKERIFTGDIKVGEKIKIKELAKEFNTSPMPIRDALNKMQAEGIIRIVSRVGYYVRTYTESEVCDIFDFRGVLEKAIIENIFSLITPELLEGWCGINNKYKAPLSKEQIHNYTHRDSLHLLLAEQCTNKHLKKTHRNIYDKTLIIDSIYASGVADYEADQQLLTILETGNLKTSIKEMDKHMEKAKTLALRQLGKSN